jgi:hypothetical protein
MPKVLHNLVVGGVASLAFSLLCGSSAMAWEQMGKVSAVGSHYERGWCCNGVLIPVFIDHQPWIYYTSHPTHFIVRNYYPVTSGHPGKVIYVYPPVNYGYPDSRGHFYDE